MKGINKTNARVLYGDFTGIFVTILDWSLPCMSHIETMEVTFFFAQRK